MGAHAMNRNILTQTRRRVGMGLAVLSVVSVGWLLTPGLPVFWAPYARADVRKAGQDLFQHEWIPFDRAAKGDGLGPVFNAKSCVACHFQGGVGGGGGNDHNVLAFEALPTKDRPELDAGLVHKFAVLNNFHEDENALHKLFPIIPGGVRLEGGCQIITRDFDPVHTQSVNSTALFGAGWIDRISSKTIQHEYQKRSLVQVSRDIQLKTEGALPGRPRELADGRIGKFGWKAQFATLEEFVAAACANEIGLGNPRMEQAKPRTKARYPNMPPDLDNKQFSSLVAFVDTLPRPMQTLPSDRPARDRAERGKVVFSSVGCALCHVPAMGGVEGVYSDFLLHRLDDRERRGAEYRTTETPQVPLPFELPLPEEWKTPPLWGVADSAPYFHDGGSGTLEDAILRHHGDAEEITKAYRAATMVDRQALIEFLKTLRAPADAVPVEGKVVVTTASR
jgi:CxxC motif-containing protein (DUF1111 family)